jgi:hypothetical protein
MAQDSAKMKTKDSASSPKPEMAILLIRPHLQNADSAVKKNLHQNSQRSNHVTIKFAQFVWCVTVKAKLIQQFEHALCLPMG